MCSGVVILRCELQYVALLWIMLYLDGSALGCVDLIFLKVCFIFPLTMLSEFDRYFWTNSTVKPGQIRTGIHRSWYVLAANAITVMESNSVTHPNTEQAQEYLHLVKGKYKIIWERSFANKLGRLAQGVSTRVQCTATIFFVPKTTVPFETKKSDIWMVSL